MCFLAAQPRGDEKLGVPREQQRTGEELSREEEILKQCFPSGGAELLIVAGKKWGSSDRMSYHLIMYFI